MHLQLDALSKTFASGNSNTTAFRDISLCVKQGEFVAIVGPSGCGKTSLLRVIAGLDQANLGDMVFSANHKSSAMVFQEHGLFPWMTLKENLAIVLRNKRHFSKDQIEETSRYFLQQIGLQEYADYLPHQVSGGMRQRVNVARAFCVKPSLLIMDEPFVFLDFQTRMTLHEMLMNMWSKEGQTVLFVTHDIEEAVLLADRVLLMTASPGCIAKEYEISLPRPRDILKVREMPDYHGPVNDILQHLRQSGQFAI